MLIARTVPISTGELEVWAQLGASAGSCSGRSGPDQVIPGRKTPDRASRLEVLDGLDQIFLEGPELRCLAAELDADTPHSGRAAQLVKKPCNHSVSAIDEAYIVDYPPLLIGHGHGLLYLQSVAGTGLCIG